MPNFRLNALAAAALGAALLLQAMPAAGVETGRPCPKVGAIKHLSKTEYRCEVSGGSRRWKPVNAMRKAGVFQGNLTILAAASLTKVLPELADAFKVANPRVSFTYSFAGSPTLAQQILAGAPADLFFAAGPAPMKTVQDGAMLDGQPSNFTSNSLVIAVPKGNPAKISGLSDLAKPGIKLVLCAIQVPCGTASAKVLALAQVKAAPVSLESDVKSVVIKVATGEADAGLVYRTDVTSDITAIDFPESAGAINTYPVAVVKGSKAASIAKAFVDFVLSAKGQAILTGDGFGKP